MIDALPRIQLFSVALISSARHTLTNEVRIINIPYQEAHQGFAFSTDWKRSLDSEDGFSTVCRNVLQNNSPSKDSALTQMIILNQSMLLVGSNYFLIIKIIRLSEILLTL